MISYRRTKAGAWVAYGPRIEVVVGEITVAKRDGTTEARTVASVGKDFLADGHMMRYGYLSPATTRAPRRNGGRQWPADHQCWQCKCHLNGAPFDGCDRCGCDGDC